MEILIVGAGIGGLATALELHAAGVKARIRLFEGATEFAPIGVGISMRPHAVRELSRLGLDKKLADIAVPAKDHSFYTHNGQLIYSEPAGIAAGYKFPHIACHRADLHQILLDAVIERLGPDAVTMAHRCTSITQDANSVTASFREGKGAGTRKVKGDLLIACDGIHSVVRKQFYPDEGGPVFHGINIWRGSTWMKPFLTGSSTVRVGGIETTGKLVIYPIRNKLDDQGRQLINWAAEVRTKTGDMVDWSIPGRLEDFYPIFESWRFDWIDCAALIRDSEFILEYPMVDRDPVTQWSFGRATLLGDAAHPMYPRGGNGGAQAILDAVALSKILAKGGDPVDALKGYEMERIDTVNRIVMASRNTPPDLVIDTVERLTGGKKFERLEDFITVEELKKINDGYKQVASYDIKSVNQAAA